MESKPPLDRDLAELTRDACAALAILNDSKQEQWWDAIDVRICRGRTSFSDSEVRCAQRTLGELASDSGACLTAFTILRCADNAGGQLLRGALSTLDSQCPDVLYWLLRYAEALPEPLPGEFAQKLRSYRRRVCHMSPWLDPDGHVRLLLKLWRSARRHR